MKPLNLDNKPCSPISSNCVIWQGPDIPCIKLCTGDTVSDVVAKLATELCTVLDILNVTNYDLSCFNLTACGPNDFQALIQFLIEQICALQNEVTIVSDPATSPITNTTKSTGADALVTIADCFVVNGITVMTVSEYAQAIGVRVCSLVSQIATINTQINDLEVRVTNLENAPVVVPPTPALIIDCNIGTLVSGNSYDIDTVLDQLINNTTNGLCSYTNTSTGVLGTPSQLLTAYITSCSYGTDVTSLTAFFTLSSKATAYIGTVAQMTGSNINNFSSQVSYIVTAEDGTTKTYIVTVTIDKNPLGIENVSSS